MTTSQIVFAFLMAVLFVTLVMRFINRAHVDDRAPIPKHVSMADVDKFTAQEVFDWLVYVTKLTKTTAYLEQINWCTHSYHRTLLLDLRAARWCSSHEERMIHFNEVATVNRLSTDILNAPI